MSPRVSLKYLINRVVVSIGVAWVLLTLLFVLLKLMPGDMTTILLDPGMSAKQIATIRARYGLDDPLWEQYLRWLSNYLVLNFGVSLRSHEPVVDMIARRLPRTLMLFGTAYLLNLTIGVLAGIHFGWNRGSTVDQAGFLGGLTLYSVPFFWLAWILLFVLAYPGFGLAVFPDAHMTTAFYSKYTLSGLITDVLWHLFVPALSLMLVGWAGNMLVMRTSMQEVLGSPYIFTARAKGLRPTTIKYKHGARNALIPVATQAIVGIAFMLDGSVVVETVFSWPGIGMLLIDSITNRDFPVALSSFYILGILIIVLRLLTDIAYTYLDPRIKFGETQ